jgi:type IV secretory pathway ATPase VirB11/archaellum biosynthesis ATPase
MSVVQLIRAGTLDAELAALLWLLVEARVPLLVAAGPRLAGKTTLLTALLEFLPAAATIHQLEGYAEDFAWLPEAHQLGWKQEGANRADRSTPLQPAGHRTSAISPATGYLVANELSPHLPFYTWGEQARIAIRALSLGYGLGATIHADSLEELFDGLRAPDVRLTDDELSHLGVVVILRPFRGEGREVLRRVVAVHYVRPMSRDAAGHVQRLAPAVLATWDPKRDAFEHFAWGLTPELAARVGRRAGDFEVEQARRRELLEALAQSGLETFADVRTAIDGYRMSSASQRH